MSDASCLRDFVVMLFRQTTFARPTLVAMFLLIIILLPVADVLWWVWAHRKLGLIQSEGNRRLARWALGIFLTFQLIALATLLGSRAMGTRISLPAIPTALLYLWHLLILPIAGIATLIGSAIAAIASRALSKETPPLAPYAGRGPRVRDPGVLAFEQEDADPSPRPSPRVRGEGVNVSRRAVLAAAAVALPPLVTVGSTGLAFAQLGTFRVRRITVPLVSLPAALDGLTIAQVSDVHIGRFTRGQTLDAIVNATNNLRADLVLMTGDLIDFRLADLPSGIDMVKRIDPRSGLFTIEGNHDLFEGRDEFERRVGAANIPLLLNSARTVSVRGFDVQLLGIRWGAGRERTSMFEEHARATIPLVRRDRDVLPILLAHHPHAFDVAAEAGIPLTLAGHTHGGQLILTDSIGPGPLMFKYWSGLYRKNDSALVVSNGVGNWFPLRLNAQAEIVHITLRRA